MKKRVRSAALFFVSILLSISIATIPITSAHAYHHNEALIKWREYGAGAFEEAARTGKPIFMLITAIWCYNCHIYWEKTLNTKEIADYINNNYIPVFLDYDKRKDIARSYPAGGIPITVILAPTGEELISVPGYIEREVLAGNLKKTVDYVKKEFKPGSEKAETGKPKGTGITLPTAGLLKSYLDTFEKITYVTYDRSFGGFGEAQKLVYPEKVMLMLQMYEKEKNKEWLERFTHTVDHMAGLKQQNIDRKRPSFKELVSLRERERTALEEVDRLQKENTIVGIFDPVEGGFFRYATRRNWTIPHYEKMLMENAEITELYLEGYRVTGNKKYGDIAKSSLDYVLRTLYSDSDGRFFGSQDADEVYYHFTAEERKTVKPPRIDKISYSASSARTIITLLHGSALLKDEGYRKAALKGLSFIEKNLTGSEGVLSYYDPYQKKGLINGQLEDNAWVAAAFIKAYEVTGDKGYLKRAEDIVKFAIDKLYDAENGGFMERNSTSKEFYREGELHSYSKPHDMNGLMAVLLVKLHKITGSKDYLKKADETAGLFAAKLASGEMTDIEPYMHRASQAIMDSGRYK